MLEATGDVVAGKLNKLAALENILDEILSLRKVIAMKTLSW